MTSIVGGTYTGALPICEAQLVQFAAATPVQGEDVDRRKLKLPA